MIYSFLSDLFLIFISLTWVSGMIILACSAAAGIVYHETEYRRTDWKKYQNAFSIKELRKVIISLEDEKVIKKLERKIFLRKIGWKLLLVTPLLILIRLMIFGK